MVNFDTRCETPVALRREVCSQMEGTVVLNFAGFSTLDVHFIHLFTSIVYEKLK